jgi:uncharacterized protein (TIGR02594 family)
MNPMETLYSIALKELGVQEHIGIAHNPRILEYHQATSLKASSDEIPWCASFVNWCLREAGLNGTNSASARSFLAWGKDILLEEAEQGDIVIFSRGSNPAFGHVGFYAGRTQTTINVLGGNQSNRVSLAAYPISKLLSVRRAISQISMKPINTTTISPAQAKELYGIEATKRVLDNATEVIKCLVDGLDVGDIRAIGNLKTIGDNIPEVWKEAKEYSEKELAELGAFALEQAGEVLTAAKITIKF